MTGSLQEVMFFSISMLQVSSWQLVCPPWQATQDQVMSHIWVACHGLQPRALSFDDCAWTFQLAVCLRHSALLLLLVMHLLLILSAPKGTNIMQT